MKTTLMTSIAVATLLLAGAAVAQDFHPILDADYLGESGTDATVAGRLDLNNPGPHSDSELDSSGSANASRLVDGNFHTLLEADILGSQGAACNGEAVKVVSRSD